METDEQRIESTEECGAVSTSLLASYLVRCNLVFPEAVEDPDGFDGGLTMARIYALGRVLFHGEEDLFLNDANAGGGEGREPCEHTSPPPCSALGPTKGETK